MTDEQGEQLAALYEKFIDVRDFEKTVTINIKCMANSGGYNYANRVWTFHVYKNGSNWGIEPISTPQATYTYATGKNHDVTYNGCSIS